MAIKYGIDGINQPQTSSLIQQYNLFFLMILWHKNLDRVGVAALLSPAGLGHRLVFSCSLTRLSAGCLDGLEGCGGFIFNSASCFALILSLAL